MYEFWDALKRFVDRLEPLERALNLPKIDVDSFDGDMQKCWEVIGKIEARLVELENKGPLDHITDESEVVDN